MSEEIDFTQVRAGDHVKVTHALEGVVRSRNKDRVDIVLPNGESALLARTAPVWERVIERIEPEYVKGGIYMSASDLLYIYDPKDAPSSLRERPWKLANSSDRREFDYPKRPMTRLEKRQ